MNFSGISNETALGRLLRSPLRLIPGNTVVPILQGRLRGKKWIVGSSSHGCWLRSYEHRKRLLFEKTVVEGGCVFDVGANVGFYTLLASVIVGAGGSVFAFEPAPSNVAYLREHLRLNEVRNVEVFEVAVSDHEGQEHFELGGHNTLGRLSASGQLVVNCARLDEMSARYGFRAPDMMKIDVEGAELAVLQGASRLLAASHPAIFLATHGAEVHGECCRLLRGLGYVLESIEGGGVEESSELIALAGNSSLERPGSEN